MSKITNIKELKNMPQEYAVYRLSAPFNYVDGKNINEFTKEELWMFNGKYLWAVADHVLVDPKVIFKAGLYLKTLEEKI